MLCAMDPIGTLMLALGALVVLDLAAPHLAGDRRARRRSIRRFAARR
jgi:hypothetical protein